MSFQPTVICPSGLPILPERAPCTRRSFLAAAAGCSFGLSTSEEARLLRPLRGLYGDPTNAVPIAQSVGWSHSRALETLRPSLRQLRDSETLRTHIDERSREDFRAGRIHRVNLWSLSETEVAIAVLLAGSVR